MPRQSFDRMIHQLQDEVILLSSMVEQALVLSVDTLKRRDVNSALQVIRNDARVNEKRFAIENNILILMATQQPIAHDLRVLAALLEVITELERIGDYAKGIAKATINLENVDMPIPINELSQMAEQTASMLHRALDAFMSENVAQAHAIPEEDAQIDELYIQVYRTLVGTMVAHPELIDHANQLLWVDHNLERAADRVTNICERAIFTATGELLELDSQDNEDTE
jgi:phosphate transport system protein